MSQLFPRRALISVSDKTGIIQFAKILQELGIELISTGGTYRLLTEAGIQSKEISDLTQFPEGLDGRVKTLHPAIHAGLLAIRDSLSHKKYMMEHNLSTIDLLVCNLYPFETVAQNSKSSHEEIIENIDIGGPAMIRSGCKNYHHVAVVTNPSQYENVIKQLNHGGFTLENREKLAKDAFVAIARYDSAIARYFCDKSNDPFPKDYPTDFSLRTTLRYGENPHQKAALYVCNHFHHKKTLSNSEILHGKELSFNNWLDLDAAWGLVRGFQLPFCAIIKHTNPCGAALGLTPMDSFIKAYDADSTSAFGGIVGFNKEVDVPAAEAMSVPGRFIECIIAPSFDAKAIDILTSKPSWKKSVRLVQVGFEEHPKNAMDFRSIDGGLLIQESDQVTETKNDWQISSKRKPTDIEISNMLLGWHVVARVKSNAIVLINDGILVGVGQGQTSRVESVRLAVAKANNRAKGAVMASDAFFPFRDGVDIALKSGITSIIQPGGSVRDHETISACDEFNAALVMTGIRHFRH